MNTSQLEGYLGKFLHKRVFIEHRNLFQARFVATILIVASVTAFSTGLPLIFFLGDPSGYVTFGFGIFISLLLLAFRLGLNTSLSFILLELSTGFHFLLCRAMQDRIDWPLAVWLTIFPILRLLYGGFRHGLGGIGYSCFLAFCMFMLESYSPFERVAVSEIISFERGVSFMIAIFIITAVFNELRMQAMGQAERAASARTLFLANMSHELRTPMNGVLGITEIILSNPIPDDIRSQLELVQRSGKQLLVLVNDILDLTRLESMKMTLEYMPADLRSLANDVIQLLKLTADQKQIALTSEVDSSVPEICLTDPIRLKQILINLVGNAVKFTSVGSVSLLLSQKADQIKFQIKDTGIGISQQVKERIFSPFEQADLSFTRRFGGSGLGLAISQRLVGILGGELSVSSNEGVGSIFSFEIRCQKGNGLQSNQNKNKSVKKVFSHRVLVVEDNEVNRYVASGMLKKCGCDVTHSTNGLEAIEAIQSKNFDLVLMDCHMPIMDGFEATRQIRKLQTHHAKIPIVALTASALAEDKESCFQCGMDDILTKPLAFEDLRRVLQKVENKSFNS